MGGFVPAVLPEVLLIFSCTKTLSTISAIVRTRSLSLLKPIAPNAPAGFPISQRCCRH